MTREPSRSKRKPVARAPRKRRASKPKPEREPDQVYRYEDPETGELHFEVCRWDEEGDKVIRQRTRGADGELVWSLEGVDRVPLYREGEFLKNGDLPLLIVEGEKCVEAVRALGLAVAVTTNPMGAGKWRSEHTRSLEHRASGVLVVPDCDSPGRNHARKVTEELGNAGIKARLLDLWPDRSDEFDLAEFIEQNPGTAGEWLQSWINPELEVLEYSVDGTFCRTRRFSSMKPEEPRPLIEDLIFRGCINLFTGKPGCGKTNVAADLAAKVTLGRPARFAVGQGHPGFEVVLDRPGNVLFMSADESVESSFQPRFLANGGDPERAFSIDEAIGIDGKGRQLTLTNLAALESALRRHEPVLVVIDGMVAFTGRTKIFQPDEVYQLLSPLRALAEKYDTAILLIRHQNKGQPDVIEDSGQGSVSFQGIARSEILIGRSPITGRRALFPIKQNYARRDLEPLAFRLEDAVVVSDEGKEVRTCQVTWEGASPLELEDLFRKTSKNGKRDKAADFLRERLESGERVSVESLKKEPQFAWRTVERAKKELELQGFKIRSSPAGFRGSRLWWHEPESESDLVVEAPTEAASPSAELLAESGDPPPSLPLFPEMADTDPNGSEDAA